MPARVAGIHVFLSAAKAWVAGTGPATTVNAIESRAGSMEMAGEDILAARGSTVSEPPRRVPKPCSQCLAVTARIRLSMSITSG